MEEAILEPDGELYVSVPIQNLTCEHVCLPPGEVLGQLQPVTLVPEPQVVAALLEGSPSNQQPIDSSFRHASLLENIHFEQSLTVEETQQLKELIINPRHACAARVTLVTWAFFSDCLFHQYLTCSTSRSQNEDINLDYTCESRHKIICLV